MATDYINKLEGKGVAVLSGTAINWRSYGY
jgi:hypothetical protein